MQVNGYQIRDAIKTWELRRDAAALQFPSTLTRFESEPVTRPSPQAVADELDRSERAIAALQTAQSKYNLAVLVSIDGTKMVTLTEAIKRLGGATRIEKLWRPTKPDRYSIADRPATSRDKTVEFAVATLTKEEQLKLAQKATQAANMIRAAIANGNGQFREIDLEPGLLGDQ